MNTLNVILAFSAFSCSLAYGQYDIRVVERAGLNWIMPKNSIASFKMTTSKGVPQADCAKVLDFVSTNKRIQACKEGDDLLCSDKIKDFLAQTARRHAFGVGFKGTRDTVSRSASVDWELAEQHGVELDPDLLFEYAQQLGIDPSNSVVSQLDKSSLALNSTGTLVPVYRPYELGQPGGNSWFFSHDVPMISTDLETQIVYKGSPAGRGFVRLTGKILNCELQTIPAEYINLPFDYTVDGLKPVSATQGSEVFGASQKITSGQMPAGSSDLDKALMYGFHLATMIKGETIQKLGMSTIIGKVFDTTGGTVKVRPYATAEEMTEALRVVASYTQEGGYIKLTPEQGD